MPFVLFGQRRNIAVGVNDIVCSTSILLDSTETQTIYIAFPSPSGPGDNSVPYDTSTIFTASDITGISKQFTAKSIHISIVPDTITIQESDSLVAYYHPLNWSPSKTAWYKASNDSTFLVFSTRASYTNATVSYLDWTHGKNYSAFLTEALIWPGSGIAITFVQYAFDNAGSATTLNIEVYIEE